MRKLNIIPKIGTKRRAKLDAMIRLHPQKGAEQCELEEIDGNGGWGTYKNDGAEYADFLGGKLHIWGEGKSRRYWIELPQGHYAAMR
ncbi:hypothetical protein [Bradyrhizobium sp.]|uniref:hypothetical protein n=1 Tax=Bradyrhizobium sp. TaxID=376 RepID=UPI002639515E|nr:hypothetical protein [Bradyrhizobium sp.]